MPIITYNGVDYPLPPDDGTGSKVPSYNETIQAILAALFGGTSATWVSWAPTLTNITIGNGTVTAKYARVGKIIFCRLNIVFGSTTSLSGDVIFTLPVTRATYAGTAGVTPLGVAAARDNSGDLVYQATTWTYSTTTQAFVRFILASGTYGTSVAASATVPFTWATADEINTQFFYEAA